MTVEIRTWSKDSTACDTLNKRARKARQNHSDPGHVPVAHPTKKVTRGRLRTASSLPRHHRKLTIKQLIRAMS